MLASFDVKEDGCWSMYASKKTGLDFFLLYLPCARFVEAHKVISHYCAQIEQFLGNFPGQKLLIFP